MNEQMTPIQFYVLHPETAPLNDIIPDYKQQCPRLGENHP